MCSNTPWLEHGKHPLCNSSQCSKFINKYNVPYAESQFSLISTINPTVTVVRWNPIIFNIPITLPQSQWREVESQLPSMSPQSQWQEVGSHLSSVSPLLFHNHSSKMNPSYIQYPHYSPTMMVTRSWITIIFNIHHYPPTTALVRSWIPSIFNIHHYAPQSQW